MSNETMRKFGYPETLVGDFGEWAVLVRPAQVTLGSLVLVSTGEATAYGELSNEAFASQGVAVRSVEKALRTFSGFERINYLMLMMVDPHVHFHVIPRYSGSRTWNGLVFPDQGWPGPPQLQSAVKLEPEHVGAMRDALAPLFKGGNGGHGGRGKD